MASLVLNEFQENIFGEKYFEEVNHLTFKNLASQEVFESNYPSFKNTEEQLFIIIGSDSGLLYEYVKKNFDKPNVRFIFIDFESVIEKTELVEGNGKANWEGNCRLVNEHFDFNLLGYEFNQYILRRNISLIKSLAVMDAKPGSPYFQLWENMQVNYTAYLRQCFNSNSAKVFEEERILNAAHNLIPASNLLGVLKGRDAIILGGGPTLDDSIEWIKENQNSLVIFAAARIALRLKKEGIVADFFVTVDPFDWSFDNSKGVLEYAEESVLAHSFHAQHKIVSQWRGLSIYMGPKYGWKTEHYNDFGNIEAVGPTVTNSALHLAVGLGAQRVFLSGIDFCFAYGRTHESGSDEVKLKDTFGKSSKAKVEDNAGNLTETGDDFYSAMQSMQQAVGIYRQKYNTEIISLGLHSAKMTGVAYQPCSELTLNQDDKKEWFKELKLSIEVMGSEVLSASKETKKELTRQLRRFKELNKLAKEAKSKSKKVYRDQSINIKGADKIKRFKRKVENLIADDGDMLMSYQAAFFHDSFKPIEDELNMSHEDVVEQLEGFFGGVEKSSHHFSKLLEQGIERVELYIDELQGTKSPEKLFASWKKWHEFGRAVIWQELHGYPANNKAKTSLEKAITEFRNEYDKKDHNYLSRVKKKVSNVSTLLIRAKMALEANNEAILLELIEHSESLDSNNAQQKESFINLLKGMKAQIVGDYPEAKEYYLSVEMSILRHEALQLGLSMAMNQENYENALIMLEQLCAISLDYMIPYGDMLVILKQYDLAVQVYMLFIQNRPENILAKLKLAQVYIQFNEFSLATDLLRAVLELEPNNQTAKHLYKSIQ
ncbi:6-hydroxymethylpterin diphosphokinase MptE-like protein [Thiomicrorhabdus sp. Milos-T2]|uniref:motility associated factor glycosyltransferase family protein n=1 Tax=Thiomicrorhabdus sp. Milos-T2 TaxID=90814 RepID=UPI000493DE0A|nr:6-hydroxymethylpterin diphosphokinase MptE-like protein [Thiomicrorhabdus sp. Milos-T2]